MKRTITKAKNNVNTIDFGNYEAQVISYKTPDKSRASLKRFNLSNMEMWKNVFFFPPFRFKHIHIQNEKSKDYSVTRESW